MSITHTNSLLTGTDGKSRCWWCGDDPEYVRYHDTEWGVPVTDDIRLFEKMSLEGFQAGLSWLTILRRRENFRLAFAGFDFTKVAQFTEADVVRLLGDAGIIRHRGKIEAVIHNARLVPAVIAEFGSFSNYLWGFAPSSSLRAERSNPELQREISGLPRRPVGLLAMTGAPKSKSEIPTQTLESIALSKDLKKRGFKFVGATTMYALMQAMGMVDDHLEGCWRCDGD